MLNVVPNGDKLNVSFDYDATKVLKVKSIPGRSYDVATKSWNIPKEGIKKLIELFGDDLIIDSDVDVTLEPAEDDKLAIFRDVLSTIEQDNMRIFAEWTLSVLPDYFYEVAASSTGKYHPKYALGYGGLARHTKAAIMIANELFSNHTIQSFTTAERDMIRVALLIHDGVKHGLNGSKYVIATHPLVVIDYIKEQAATPGVPNDVLDIINSDVWNQISNNIATHMGEWNYDYKTKEPVLPKPETEMQKFTHLCDYLASRKILEVLM